MKKIKVVFFGTPEFAILPLEALIEAKDIDVVAVVTQDDKPVGRKQELTAPPVKNAALEQDIPVLQPTTLRKNPQILELLEGLEADFFAVVAYGKILPKEVLDIPKYGCINLHGSLLPQYRGASPVEEALLQGDAQTGVSFIQMNEELDAGDILVVQRQAVDPEDTSETLRRKLSLLGAALFPQLLRDVVDEVIQPIPQNSQNATFCHKITKQDGFIDIYKERAEDIVNKIRAYTPWPSCFMIVKDKRLKIIKAKAAESLTQVEPGAVIEGTFAGEYSIGLQTIEGTLWLQTVQLEGKKPTLIQDFMRGNKSFFAV